MRTRLVLSSLLLAACGTEDPLALEEPLVVHQADFKEGALPERVAPAGAPATDPAVTSFQLGFGVLRPGTVNASVSGRAAKSAYSVGVRFRDQGTGYWVKPMGSEDPLMPGELQWQLSLDAATHITPGLHDLEVVAFDQNGQPGSKSTQPVCVASELPDNLNVCNPKNSPPLTIASLSWNSDADLDLTVVAPDGTTYGRSKRSLLSGTRVIARLDGDGVSGCLADGRRRESFLWNELPGPGSWALYANLFDSCGKQSVTFELTIHQRVQNPDGTFGLSELRRVTGKLVRPQANGGAGNPLFVTELNFF